MNPTEAYRPARTDAEGSGSGPEDPRVLRAVEEYLAALEAGRPPGRDAFLGRHAAIAARLGEYLDGLELLHRAGSAAGPAPAGAAAADGLAGAEPLGDFLLVREVGRGGMGVVYEARQRSLDRTVALKVLPLAAALEPRQLQRFKNEAVAAASLHHEHIIPVYAVGCERGVHFYAMQFIEGCTVAQLVQALRPADEQPAADPARTVDYRPGRAEAPTPPVAVLSTERSGPRGRSYYRRVAELMAQAAEALEHAHGLGIVHRDVKPGNLLVDAAGKLWVGDFGLARLGAEAGLTLSGDLLGTLRYMAPEQALARHGLVDHRADVYGLGATLYELLTLRPAVTATERAEVLRQVAFEEPVAPRKLDKAIPVELETVALKCLAKNPAERYATAGELAEDLRRWLADQPIRARRPSLVQRARRWARRHRALAGGGAAALLVGLCAALAVLGLKNRELTAATAREHQTRTEAEAARDAAEERFALAQGAVDQYLAKITEDPELRDKHGLHELRKRLLQTAVPFYEKLAQQKPGNAEQEANRARAYARLGSVRSLLGETAAALTEFEQTRAIFARLAADFPTAPEYREGLAGSHYGRGNQLANLGKRPEAEAEYRRALALWEQLAADFPTVPAYRQGLASSHNDLGRVLGELGKRPDAEAEYRRAIALWERLAADFRAVPAYREGLAHSRHNLGMVLVDLGKRPEAETEYRRAIALHAQLVTDFPAVPAYRQDLAKHHDNLGQLLQDLGKRVEAETEHRQALDIWNRLAADFPTVPAYRQGLAASHNSLGVLLRALGKQPEAEAQYRQSLAHLKQLVADFPTVPAYRQTLAGSHMNLGGLLWGLGKLPEAEAEFRESLALRKQLASDFPTVPGYRQNLAGSHNNLGILLKDLGKQPEAEAQYRQSLALLKQLVADFPTVPAYRQHLAFSHANLGNLLTHLGKWPEAEAEYRRALALFAKLASDFPTVPEYRQHLASSQHNLGILLMDLGKRPEAEGHYRRALALQAQLAADFPTVPEYRQDLARSHTNLGTLLRDLGKRPEAEGHYRQALALKEQLAADLPTMPQYRHDLANSHLSLGQLLFLLGKPAEAEAEFRRAITLLEKLVADLPTVPAYAVELGNCYFYLGQLVRNVGEDAASLGWFAKAIAVLQQTLRRGPDVRARQCLCLSHAKRAIALTRLGKQADALPDWDRAFALAEGVLGPLCCLWRAEYRAYLGEHRKATAEAEAILQVSPPDADVLASAAYVFAAAAGKAGDGALGEAYAARAMALLKDAVTKGYQDVADLKQDPNLERLRARADFQKLVADLEAKQKPAPPPAKE
jgi:serine/threonine protein kinase/Tfp pilus assembly protein PilF